MKIVTLGEIMIRLQPYDHLRFVQTDTLQYTYGGGEANVAVSLANYGADVAFVTKLPAHAIGQAGVNALRRYGVDTSKITRGGDRVGIYFNEKGASQRGSVCIYDRAHSAMADATVADFDFDKIFEGVDWFHFTGITPALGPNVVEICLAACKAAKAHGAKISCDLNYRGKLWTRAEEMCIRDRSITWASAVSSLIWTARTSRTARLLQSTSLTKSPALLSTSFRNNQFGWLSVINRSLLKITIRCV